MNILPKKSWHVRTKKNIERVRSDEAKAAEEEKEVERRKALAEQEARIDLLRRRKLGDGSHSKDEQDRGKSEIIQFEPAKHINFFEAEEEGKQKTTNDDYEKEKNAEKEKYEKSIGLLTYLGQSSIESQTEKTWYDALPPQIRKRKRSPEVETTPNEKRYKRLKEEEDKKKKAALDPMMTMAKYVDITKKVDDKKHGRDRYDEKSKKHKHQHKDKNNKNSIESGKKTIEQLRTERLRREKAEREKTEKLLAKMRGETPKEEEKIPDERTMKYNSQFNPEFVRKPRKPRDMREFY
ncbi:leukocyte receptor cluster member 1 homolog isoform X2 [Lineus longissimus]|uniref:leukocyte receptor cluster member 1 homolog isoform X2 n=1 Tax=Lineus longissimus TaxID=88925 RepID=UPI00315D09C2